MKENKQQYLKVSKILCVIFTYHGYVITKYCWGRFHEKSQFETSFGLSLGLKSETVVLAEFLAQIDFTKGDSAETGLKS